MYKFLICFLIHWYTAESEGGHRFFSVNVDENKSFYHITKCIKAISDLALSYNPTVTITTVSNNQKENTFMEYLAKHLQENNIPTAIVYNEEGYSLLDNNLVIKEEYSDKKYHLNGLIIMYFKTCDDISSSILKEIDYAVKHLIIISGVDTCIRKLEEISDIVGEHDVTFMFHDLVGELHQMFTFITKIDENTCKAFVERPIHINTCVNGTLASNEIFPSKKPTNLNKCPLRVGMATLYPFSQIENKESLQTYDRINETKGSDMTIMQIVAQKINASLDLYYVYRKEENPYVENGFLRFLINGSLDVCAGGLYRIYGDIVAYSGIYARQAVVWIYYAERVDRSWENLIGKVNGLYFFIIFYIIYSIIWYFVRIFDKDTVSLRNTLLYGWGALVGATSLQDARSMKQKILNLGYLVMSIHLSAYISIQLFSFLTIREPLQMFNTNEDVMDSGRVPYLITSTKYFVDDKRYLNFANTSEECFSFIDCAEKTFENNGLTIVLQGNFYHFQSATAVNGEARVLRAAENILTVYNEMLIRKDSPLVFKFRRIIQSLFEAGITERLYNEAIGILVIAKANYGNSNMITSSSSCQAGCTITFMQFAGVFYVWIFGCMLSCAVFVLEIFTKRERK